MTSIVFYHGALVDTYEEQANKQGFTLGDHAEFAQPQTSIGADPYRLASQQPPEQKICCRQS